MSFCHSLNGKKIAGGNKKQETPLILQRVDMVNHINGKDQKQYEISNVFYMYHHFSIIVSRQVMSLVFYTTLRIFRA